jgi:hypothetical protein
LGEETQKQGARKTRKRIYDYENVNLKKENKGKMCFLSQTYSTFKKYLIPVD